MYSRMSRRSINTEKSLLTELIYSDITQYPVDLPGWKCPFCKHTYRFARTHVFKKHYAQIVSDRGRAELHHEINQEMPLWDGS